MNCVALVRFIFILNDSFAYRYVRHKLTEAVSRKANFRQVFVALLCSFSLLSASMSIFAQQKFCSSEFYHFHFVCHIALSVGKTTNTETSSCKAREEIQRKERKNLKILFEFSSSGKATLAQCLKCFFDTINCLTRCHIHPELLIRPWQRPMMVKVQRKKKRERETTNIRMHFKTTNEK